MAAQGSGKHYQTLTLRLGANDLQRLKDAAECVGMKPTVLARVLIQRGLQESGEESQFPFSALASLLSPLAHRKCVSEKSIAQRVKRIRRRRWEEHYRKPVEEIWKEQRGS